MYSKLLFGEISLKGGNREALLQHIDCLLSSAKSFEDISSLKRKRLVFDKNLQTSRNSKTLTHTFRDDIVVVVNMIGLYISSIRSHIL